MSTPQISTLPAVMRPLLNKFYRAHHSPMRAGSDDQLWVAKSSEIVAALCLRAVGQGADFWLTGLFVAPTQRGQQIASQLVNAACANTHGAVWLFCHPQLLTFYARLGFAQADHLPPSLAERFQRYSRSKPLLALSRDGQALASGS